MDYKNVLDYYKSKRVFITGNTGFKGAWLTQILLGAGAYVTGYSLEPPTNPNLFHSLSLEKNSSLKQYYADVRDLGSLKDAVATAKPDVVFHLAAQPIVLESYKNPVDTYSTNVMGTVNICECVRLSHILASEGGLRAEDSQDEWQGVESFLNVTTDKVYKNREWEYGYREDDPLDGFDPYSNSKSCSEMVTHSYTNAFFKNMSVAVSTARAGNVIGGGDYADNRIIPDCLRTAEKAKKMGMAEGVIDVRNPFSTRPYQHVLEPLFTYLLIAKAQNENRELADYYNVGPNDTDCITTGELVSIFCNEWNKQKTDNNPVLKWNCAEVPNAPHEANFLKLDCSRLKQKFGWAPQWGIQKTIEETVRFMTAWMTGGNIIEEVNREIEEFISAKML
ncbi:MAG: CDP-glucose 4,6-dehydratase [Lachnospiraceae bacterium]|nr:CDP-glucose 4,6-dehydratase [Lachnospiraceae bacterium]